MSWTICDISLNLPKNTIFECGERKKKLKGFFFFGGKNGALIKQNKNMINTRNHKIW